MTPRRRLGITLREWLRPDAGGQGDRPAARRTADGPVAGTSGGEAARSGSADREVGTANTVALRHPVGGALGAGLPVAGAVEEPAGSAQAARRGGGDCGRAGPRWKRGREPDRPQSDRFRAQPISPHRFGMSGRVKGRLARRAVVRLANRERGRKSREAAREPAWRGGCMEAGGARGTGATRCGPLSRSIWMAVTSRK